MKKLLQDPLVHFLALGSMLFLASYLLDADDTESDPYTIVVDEERLVNFLENRSKLRAADLRGVSLAQLSPDQLAVLVDDYVEEEAMYREAAALRLDGDDYLARLRAIQRLEFVMRQSAGNAAAVLDDGAINSYYAANRQEFLVAPTITFTHVFFSADRHGIVRARELAIAARDTLNVLGAGFGDAARYGDRFLYQKNYALSGYDEVDSHFGEAMRKDLVTLVPDKRRWQGPLQSTHGSHLVLVSRKTAAYVPSLEDVRVEAERRLRQEIEANQLDTQRRELLTRYEVSFDGLNVLQHQGSELMGGKVGSAGRMAP